jgi:hypothetical protein
MINNEGSFIEGDSYEVSNDYEEKKPGITDIDIGDFNNDGSIDIAVSSFRDENCLEYDYISGQGWVCLEYLDAEDHLNVFFNNGQGVLTRSNFPYDVGTTPYNLAVSDFDANDFDDIAVSVAEGTSIVFNEPYENPDDDDERFDDDSFLINKTHFCYDREVHECDPDLGTYIAGRVRLREDARDYEAPKFEYYCTGI